MSFPNRISHIIGASSLLLQPIFALVLRDKNLNKRDFDDSLSKQNVVLGEEGGWF
jgi:hypothetical protein